MSLSVQLLGSALVLIAFAAAQGGRMSQNSRRYLGLNVLGSFALGISALAAAQWGFLALEAHQCIRGTQSGFSAVGERDRKA